MSAWPSVCPTCSEAWKVRSKTMGVDRGQPHHGWCVNGHRWTEPYLSTGASNTPELTKWVFVANGLNAIYGYFLPGMYDRREEWGVDTDDIVVFVPLDADLHNEALYPSILDGHHVHYERIPKPQAQ